MSAEGIFDFPEFEPVVENLKHHLRVQLTSGVQFWDNLKGHRNRNVNYFITQNVKIEDEEGNVKTNVKNFNDLFNSLTCRRIVASGDDGYGKSTLVQEMARQWVEGGSSWTQKFWFVFSFRLTEIPNDKLETLPKLFQHCLPEHQAIFAYRCLKNAKYSEKILIIFDGVDEVENAFGDEINDLITGNGPYFLPFVILTMKPGDHCDRLTGDSTARIKLNGFTENGINEQIGNLSSGLDKSLYHILKVPLFNVFYQIISEEGPRQSLTIVGLIEKYVKLLARGYRRKNSLFTELQQNELILMLGQTAQAKYSMINVQPNVRPVNFTEKFLNFAISIGYVRENSTQTEIVFPHRILADYFAACFWSKKNSTLVKPGPYLEMVEFLEPHQGCCSSLSTFSSMLSYYDKNYNLFLWNNFVEHVPLLDDYKNLPIRTVNVPILRFPDISSEASSYVISNLQFNYNKVNVANKSNNVELSLYKTKFEPKNPFVNLKQFQKIYLFDCLLTLSPSEFFRIYNNVKDLELEQCSFQINPLIRLSFSDDDEEKQKLQLERLVLNSCDDSCKNWLNFVITESTKLRGLFLYNTKLDDSWIDAIQSNSSVLKSLNNFHLSLKSPTSMTRLLFAISAMPNLFQLSFGGCYLSQSELDILAEYFEKSAKRLKRLCLEDDENVGKCQPLIKSIGKLTSLKHLEISDCRLTRDALDNLESSICLLRLEKCAFTNELVINTNSNFLSGLNSCRTLKEITFDKCGFMDIELELSKNLLNQFSFESEKIMREGRVDTVLRFFKSS